MPTICYQSTCSNYLQDHFPSLFLLFIRRHNWYKIPSPIKSSSSSPSSLSSLFTSSFSSLSSFWSLPSLFLLFHSLLLFFGITSLHSIILFFTLSSSSLSFSSFSPAYTGSLPFTLPPFSLSPPLLCPFPHFPLPLPFSFLFITLSSSSLSFSSFSPPYTGSLPFTLPPFHHSLLLFFVLFLIFPSLHRITSLHRSLFLLFITLSSSSLSFSSFSPPYTGSLPFTLPPFHHSLLLFFVTFPHFPLPTPDHFPSLFLLFITLSSSSLSFSSFSPPYTGSLPFALPPFHHSLLLFFVLFLIFPSLHRITSLRITSLHSSSFSSLSPPLLCPFPHFPLPTPDHFPSLFLLFITLSSSSLSFSSFSPAYTDHFPSLFLLFITLSSSSLSFSSFSPPYTGSLPFALPPFHHSPPPLLCPFPHFPLPTPDHFPSLFLLFITLSSSSLSFSSFSPPYTGSLPFALPPFHHSLLLFFVLFLIFPSLHRITSLRSSSFSSLSPPLLCPFPHFPLPTPDHFPSLFLLFIQILIAIAIIYFVAIFL